MKFKSTMKSSASLKKKKDYDFEISEKDKKIGLSKTYPDQHFINTEDGLVGLSNYNGEGKLRLVLYLGYFVFKEIN